MKRVSIAFGKGVLVVKDEDGKQVDAQRATVFLIAGNDHPVALVELANGGRVEVPVNALDVAEVLPIVSAPELPADADPPARRK